MLAFFSGGGENCNFKFTLFNLTSQTNCKKRGNFLIYILTYILIFLTSCLSFFSDWTFKEKRGRSRKYRIEMLYDAEGVVKIFCCPNDCGRKYRHSSSLSNHLKYECSVEKQFHCPVCGKTFSRKPTLKLHLVNLHKELL